MPLLYTTNTRCDGGWYKALALNAFEQPFSNSIITITIHHQRIITTIVIYNKYLAVSLLLRRRLRPIFSPRASRFLTRTLFVLRGCRLRRRPAVCLGDRALRRGPIGRWFLSSPLSSLVFLRMVEDLQGGRISLRVRMR